MILDQVVVQGVSPPVWIYLLAYAPESPADIEAAMTRTEVMMAVAYKKILSAPMWDAVPRAKRFVIEVGVHGGWFATLAYKFGGHRVIGFDMQPLCTSIARCALQVNGASEAQSVVLNRYVSHGGPPMGVASDSCGGGLGVGNRQRGEVSVHPVHLGQFFTDRDNLLSLNLDPAGDFEVPLLKSDTEGFEGIIFETALPILPKIHNILVEVFAPRWKLHGIPEERALAVFQCLHAAGMSEMIDLPRRDIDFQTPGDIDLDNIPQGRIHKTWEEWRTQFGYILAEKNGLINPNVWIRWTSEEARLNADLTKVPECAAPLAKTTYDAPA